MALRSHTKNRPTTRRESDTAPSAAGSTVRARRSAISTPQADTTLQTVLNRLAEADEYCVDVETSGLDWRHNAIVGYVFTFGPAPQDSYYVPFRHAGKANVGGRDGLKSPTGWKGDVLPGERELVKAADRQGVMAFGHNLAFDLRFLSRVGFTMKPRFEDTMINEPLLDEYTKYSLEACAVRHGVQAKKGTSLYAYMADKLSLPNDKNVMGHFWRLSGDDPQAVEYAAGDGTSTWQLRDAQMDQIRFQGLDLVHSVESRLISVLARMMVRGVHIDEERLGTIIADVGRQAEILLNEFPSGFNALSPDDVRRWMEKHGHADWPRTKPTKNRPDGSPSFTEKYLKTHDAGRKILELRKLNNLNSSFCVPLRDEHVWNGRVHTTFNQLRNDDFGTVTGRLSSNGPNLQQVPKHNEELGRLIRSVYVPDFGLWGERDYSQIEPRLMAYYTRARVFLDDYRNNPKADSHTAVAKMMHPNWDGLSKDEQKTYRNVTAKRCNQTVITGGGPSAVARKYGMSEDDARELFRIYMKAVPELKPFQKKAARRFRERGFVMSVLGRRAHLRDPDKDYTAMNRLLQMSNADILKLKMVELQDYLDGETVAGKAPVEMLLNCHDALSFQFQLDAKSRAVYAQCKALMEDFHSGAAVIKLDLPIRVDEGEGKNWAEATYGGE